MSESRRQHSPHFLERADDGSAKVRLKFTPDEAAEIEAAAGDTPVILWLHRTLKRESRRQARKARAKLRDLPPPT